MLRRRLLQVGLAAASALATLSLVEGGLRLAGVHGETQEFRFQRAAGSLLEDAGRYVVHPRRFFALAAHCRGVAGHPRRYSSGAWPYRGRPIEPAPAGIYRIGLFGDSCIYGATLDAADMLGEQLARSLQLRGFSPTQVQVASFGVPGYSTVQIRELLCEVLAEHRLDLAVFYAAAWNDQSPALGPNDLALRARAERGAPLYESTATFAFLRRIASSSREIDMQAIFHAWTRGAPIFGTRVPAPNVSEELRAMVHRARAASCDVHFLVPAHPPRTRRERPRLLEDAESVRRVALEERVPMLDTPALFAANPTGEERLFADYVHPSPDGVERLAEALAEDLLPHLQQRLKRQARVAELDWGAIEVLPRSFSCFGGAHLALRFERARFGAELPAVVIGGAPLLELARDPDGRTLRGTLLANRAGVHDLLVQSSSGCALYPSAVELAGPRLEIERGQRWKLRFWSQPGDLALVQIADRLRAAPSWSDRGAHWIDADHALPSILPMRAGAAGDSELEMDPPVQAPGETLYLQAEVHRHGPDEQIIESRWTPVLEVRRAH